MKTLLLSTGLALGLGALAMAPASAAPIVKTTVAATAATTDAACRTVERRVRSNGVTRITRSRTCDDSGYGRRSYGERRAFYADRRAYRDDRREYRREYRRSYGSYGERRYRDRDRGPGFSIRVN